MVRPGPVALAGTTLFGITLPEDSFTTGLLTTVCGGGVVITLPPPGIELGEFVITLGELGKNPCELGITLVIDGEIIPEPTDGYV